MPQSTIGRIEAGLTEPRSGTLDAALRACGFGLTAVFLDQVAVRRRTAEQLRRTPAERIQTMVDQFNRVAATDEGIEPGWRTDRPQDSRAKDLAILHHLRLVEDQLRGGKAARRRHVVGRRGWRI